VAAKAAAEEANSALSEVSTEELAAYIRSEIPPTEFASLLGEEYVAAMLGK
jgi:hypothetical protein